MPDPTLNLGQYSIGTEMPGGDPASVVYGYGTQVLVANTAVDPGNVTTQDVAVTGHDGQMFGIDTLPGMQITQTGTAFVNANGKAALDAFGVLAAKWMDPLVRFTPDAVQILRAYYPVSGVIRRCYGRGRRIAPTYGLANQGAVPFTSIFQASDTAWYSETENALTLTTAPSFLGTLLFPVTPPFNWGAQANFQQNAILNTGPSPTWPVITFTGPSSNGNFLTPTLSYVNTPVQIGYNGTLHPGDQLVIDTRPWKRTCLLNGASVAGAMTGNPLITMQLQPGSTVARLGGTDATGTATCVIKWRNAFQAIGGTLS